MAAAVRSSIQRLSPAARIIHTENGVQQYAASCLKPSTTLQTTKNPRQSSASTGLLGSRAVRSSAQQQYVAVTKESVGQQQ